MAGKIARVLQDDAAIGSLLARVRTVAVVGVSDDPRRPSFGVCAYLLARAQEYDVWFVHPDGGSVLGRPRHRSLAELPGVPDLVDVFRRADACPDVAHAAVAVGARALWLQLGVVSDEAAGIATAAGLDVVMDRCIEVEHARRVRPPGGSDGSSGPDGPGRPY